MSALPMYTTGSPPPTNAKMRECSRKRPRMLRTRMLSLRPGTPGRTAQMPRTTMSTSTPACEARYSESTNASSTIEFTLIRMPAGRPFSWLLISRSTRSTRPCRTVRGATSRRR